MKIIPNSVQDVIIPELMKKLDILGDNGVGSGLKLLGENEPCWNQNVSLIMVLLIYFLQNLRNEEQVAVIQAGTVISLCEKVSERLCCYWHTVDRRWNNTWCNFTIATILSIFFISWIIDGEQYSYLSIWETINLQPSLFYCNPSCAVVKADR